MMDDESVVMCTAAQVAFLKVIFEFVEFLCLFVE